jgi:hypothetical protein
MEIIAVIILAIALLLGLAVFVFQNAAKIVALVLVLFIGYIGWHIYLKDQGITPKQVTDSVNNKGESIFNDVLDTVFGSVSSASNSAKEKALEATDKVKDTTKHKADELTSKAK